MTARSSAAAPSPVQPRAVRGQPLAGSRRVRLGWRLLRQAHGDAGGLLQLGYPIDDYLEPGHPLQQSILGPCRRNVPPWTGALSPACHRRVQPADLRLHVASIRPLVRGPGRDPNIHGAALTRLRDAMMAHPKMSADRARTSRT